MGYEVVLADFPWAYTSYGTAKLPYETMSWEKIRDFDWREFVGDRFVLFSWVTAPLLAQQMLVHECWRERFGWRYVGMPYVWVKTTNAGALVGAVGPRPTLVKSQTEFVIAYTNVRRGRPFPLLTEAQTPWLHDDGEFVTQEVPAPRREHSAKPAMVRQKIEELFGPLKRLELFAREANPGWDTLGNQSPTTRVF
jgi:N6-adenosine-specific RNA methylase IME4